MQSDSEGEGNASNSEGEGAGAQGADRAALKKQLSDAIASAKSHVGRVWTAVDLNDEEFLKQHKKSTLASLLGVDECFISKRLGLGLAGAGAAPLMQARQCLSSLACPCWSAA